MKMSLTGFLLGILGLVLITVCFILGMTNYPKLMIIPVLIFFAVLMVYCLQNLSNNIFLFCFLLCFFTFLLCGHAINRLYQVYGFKFSEEIELHTDLALLISLIGLISGYILCKKIRIKTIKTNTAKGINYEGFVYKNARKISKTLYLITYLLWLLTLLDTVLFVFQFGYVNYYLSYSSRVPALIREVAYMSPVFFYIFLSTMPQKKEAKLPIVLYLIYAIFSLGTGRRLHFMVALMFIFAYCMLRNSIRPGQKPWISKKGITLICLGVPLILIAMYIFEYIRSEYFVGSSDQFSPLVGFFVRQGTSINVIKYGELYRSSLNPEAHYSFYNTIQWFQNSFLAQIFNPKTLFEFGKQTQATATSGTYLADFVSYHANQYSYEIGMGYGSCYIEELYIDFGYMGVFLGNVFYGALLRAITNYAKRGNQIWLMSLAFFAVNEIFKAPRATFDACFGRLFYFSYWGPVVMVAVIVYIFKKRNKRSVITGNKVMSTI